MRERGDGPGTVAGRSGVLLTVNAALLEQLDLLPNYAKYDVTVLVLGETGTGKELVARELHRLSCNIISKFQRILGVGCLSINVLFSLTP